MAKSDGNNGAGYIVNNHFSNKCPEGTFRNCDGWYVSHPDHPIVIGGCGVYVDEKNVQLPYLRLAGLNYLQVAKWPVVLDFFADKAYQPTKKSETRYSVVAIYPGSDAFGSALARSAKCVGVYVDRADTRDGNESNCFRFRNGIGKGEQTFSLEKGEKGKVLIALGTMSDLSDVVRFAEEIADAGGKVTGIVCVVNDTFPLATECSLPGKKAVPIFSVLSPEIPKYRQDAPQVADAVRTGNIILNPYEADAWNELLKSMKKSRKKKE